MKQSILITLVLAISVSCGKKETYNDQPLQDRLNDLDAIIQANNKALQEQYNELLERVVELETDQPVIELVDPCPSVSAQFREVLVRTDSSIFAYFEQGGQRFLTALVDGNYRTTDKRACNFTIRDGQVVR
jgi:hypothetical protein